MVTGDERIGDRYVTLSIIEPLVDAAVGVGVHVVAGDGWKCLCGAMDCVLWVFESKMGVVG